MKDRVHNQLEPAFNRTGEGNVVPSSGEETPPARALLNGDDGFSDGGIIGRSDVLQEVLKNVAVVSPTDCTVLIEGETGTGKELLAQAIHSRSRRSSGPFVRLNCGAIPVHLIESELFGHEKGAFTGALNQRLGRFELADGGTLFLDEIAEMPPEAQVRTLRALQEREFDRVGGTETVSVDVRIVAATNGNLLKRVNNGRFREDLFYRLNVFPVMVPPLRDRIDDIPLLVQSFLHRFSSLVGRAIEEVPEETFEQLFRYDWPGNIRELQNVIERAVILAFDGVLRLPPDSLPERDLPSSSASLGRFGTLQEVVRRHIVAALERCNGVVAGPEGAASLLGLNPSTLKSRMKKLGISRFS